MYLKCRLVGCQPTNDTGGRFVPATRHRQEETRHTKLGIEGDIDIIKYAPAYLFSMTRIKTEIFNVDNNEYAQVLYTIE